MLLAASMASTMPLSRQEIATDGFFSGDAEENDAAEAELGSSRASSAMRLMGKLGRGRA